jgi:hypothetical protein
MPTKPRQAIGSRAMHGAAPQPPARVGTRSLTAHVGQDVHQAVHALAEREHLKVDELLQIALALVLTKNNCGLPTSLDQKLKHRRLISYLAPVVPS